MQKIVEFASGIIIMGIIIAVILLFIAIGVLVVIHICIAGRTLERRFTASASDLDANRRSRRSLSKDELEKLPCFNYLVKDIALEDCAVCLENFQGGEKCRLLPVCNHSFHAHCVDSWLVRNPVCPICRASAGDDHRLLVGEESGRVGYTGGADFSRSDWISERSRGGIRGGNEVRIEVREGRIVEGSNVRDHGSESSEMQIDLSMIELSASNVRVL